MIRSALFPRIIFCLLLMIVLTACGGAAAAPEPPEAPAAEAPPESPVVAQPTQDIQGEVVSPPVNTHPAPTALPNTSGPVNPTFHPAIPERRRLTLEFPPRIRAGDSDIVRLTLEVDELGTITPTAGVEGNLVQGEVVQIPNLYDTHHVIAEARFDIAGLEVAPPDLVSQPLAQGQSVTFLWSILPEGVGNYRGTVWLYLRFVDKISGEENPITVSAQSVDIESVNFLGFSGSLARSFGVIGSILGTIIGFPFFEDIVKFLFKRRNSR
ncbi:MAG TPA: hypothetical protein VJ022_07660 [Anaerolineales bacterium]|nr:hypothetical protein [Anaerolineales bacterium]